ncbi:MAG: MBL fold metallo-hydrolase [Dehalococcoidia bacterium]|nr:MAG: MBL fold metallo-hydrolase [Dehalococcoidia bacterium]
MKLTEHLYFYPENGMMDCNHYLVKDAESLLIDPGSSQFSSELIAQIKRDGIKPEDIKLITNTHLHPDHCWANSALKQASGAKIISHPVQENHHKGALSRMGSYFGIPGLGFEVDEYLKDGKLTTGKLTLEVIAAPGHARESVCFYCPEEKFLVTGDVVFSQNIGRYDFPGGSLEDLKKSVETLSRLDIEYLLPGHMDIVSGAENVRQNFEFIARYVFNSL